MADSKSIISMSVPEIGSFADRLSEGGDALIAEATAQAADLKASARIIKALLRPWHTSDLVKIDS
jgi:hypothetical protein